MLMSCPPDPAKGSYTIQRFPRLAVSSHNIGIEPAKSGFKNLYVRVCVIYFVSLNINIKPHHTNAKKCKACKPRET